MHVYFLQILNISPMMDDGTVRVRWRIKYANWLSALNPFNYRADYRMKRVKALKCAVWKTPLNLSWRRSVSRICYIGFPTFFSWWMVATFLGKIQFVPTEFLTFYFQLKWFDGYSIFFVAGDGLVYRFTLQKVVHFPWIKSKFCLSRWCPTTSRKSLLRIARESWPITFFQTPLENRSAQQKNKFFLLLLVFALFVSLLL